MSIRHTSRAVGAAAALVVLAAPAASAHTHGINPLECTPAPANAGGNPVGVEQLHPRAGLRQPDPVGRPGLGRDLAVCLCPQS